MNLEWLKKENTNL